eukprot:GHVU01198282.1.p1 GENE.GHVU01198282.1~~GHVU01198282.1.p1  ORF type:complete len:387 (-),score=21.67 GHVU01198282.1:1681-2841(-)
MGWSPLPKRLLEIKKRHKREKSTLLDTMFLMPRAVAAERVYERGYDPMERLSNRKMYKQFRVDKPGLRKLQRIIQDDLSVHYSMQGRPIPTHIVILVALAVFASNSFQHVIGRTVGLCQATVSRCVHEVTQAVVARKDQFIQWPHSQAMRQQFMQGFFNVAAIPGVIGCVDGTQIRIQKPVVDEQDYVCRKGYHSLNVMAICGPDGTFSYVLAQWAGSTHDAFIMNNSQVARSFENRLLRGTLLGDSGYRCRPWLLTPYRNPRTDREVNFNERHRATRVAIECGFGKVKKRFAILGSVIRLRHDIIPAVIVACFCIHNFVTREGIRARVLQGPREGPHDDDPDASSAQESSDDDDSIASDEDDRIEGSVDTRYRDVIAIPDARLRR